MLTVMLTWTWLWCWLWPWPWHWTCPGTSCQTWPAPWPWPCTASSTVLVVAVWRLDFTGWPMDCLVFLVIYLLLLLASSTVLVVAVWWLDFHWLGHGLPWLLGYISTASACIIHCLGLLLLLILDLDYGLPWRFHGLSTGLVCSMDIQLGCDISFQPDGNPSALLLSWMMVIYILTWPWVPTYDQLGWCLNDASYNIYLYMGANAPGSNISCLGSCWAGMQIYINPTWNLPMVLTG